MFGLNHLDLDPLMFLYVLPILLLYSLVYDCLCSTWAFARRAASKFFQGFIVKTTPKAAKSYDGTAADGRPRDDSDCSEWHEVLGTSPSSTHEEIRRAYRQRMSEYHPDKVSQLGIELRELAERKSQEINAAYEFIMTARAAKVDMAAREIPDEAYFEMAEREIEGGLIRPELWSQAWTDSHGDGAKVTGLYLRLRVASMKSAAHASFNKARSRGGDSELKTGDRVRTQEEPSRSQPSLVGSGYTRLSGKAALKFSAGCGSLAILIMMVTGELAGKSPTITMGLVVVAFVTFAFLGILVFSVIMTFVSWNKNYREWRSSRRRT